MTDEEQFYQLQQDLQHIEAEQYKVEQAEEQALIDSLKKRGGMSRLYARLGMREREWDVIEKIWPGNAVHLVSGQSGAGKTTWLLQVLYNWEKSIALWGYKSHPCPWVYVSIDRATHETDKTLRRIGIEDWDAPIYSIEDITNVQYGYSMDTILQHPKFAHCRLFVIEGLQALIPSPGPRQSQNQCEMQWMVGLRQHLLATQRTIIAVTHPPKSKKGESSLQGRSDVLGSQSLGATAGTMIKVDHMVDEEGQELDQRLVTFDGRDFKKFSLVYEIDEFGRFRNPQEFKTNHQTGEQIKARGSANLVTLDQWLLSRPAGPFQFSEMLMLGQTHKISEATLKRWLDAAIKRGLVARIAHGMYQRVLGSST